MHHTTVYLLQPDALLHFVHITSHQPSNRPLTLTMFTISISTVNMTTVSSSTTWYHWTLCVHQLRHHTECAVRALFFYILTAMIVDCSPFCSRHASVWLTELTKPALAITIFQTRLHKSQSSCKYLLVMFYQDQQPPTTAGFPTWINRE